MGNDKHSGKSEGFMLRRWEHLSGLDDLRCTASLIFAVMYFPLICQACWPQAGLQCLTQTKGQVGKSLPHLTEHQLTAWWSQPSSKALWDWHHFGHFPSNPPIDCPHKPCVATEPSLGSEHSPPIMSVHLQVHCNWSLITYIYMHYSSSHVPAPISLRAYYCASGAQDYLISHLSHGYQGNAFNVDQSIQITGYKCWMQTITTMPTQKRPACC